jgi:site-specific DNA-methyltransferase (adenine-specific)
MSDWIVLLGDCVAWMRELPDASVDAIVTDPPYAEIDRPYGRLTEVEWHALMRAVVTESQRVLKPHGSAVFILQPNSERVGRMRPWLWEFMAWTTREWNMVQDAWWWNPAAVPTVHCNRHNGLMRPSLKACVWLGAPDCYRNQEAVLWSPSDAMKRAAKEDMALRRSPSGHSVRRGRMATIVDERGGVTPFNVLPLSNANSTTSGGAHGHGAATPLALAEWWVRYITPSGEGSVVLDPFCGSGTMGLAARKHGSHFIGIEKMPGYLEIAEARLAAA